MKQPGEGDPNPKNLSIAAQIWDARGPVEITETGQVVPIAGESPSATASSVGTIDYNSRTVPDTIALEKVTPVEIKWSNIALEVKVKKEWKRVLDDVSGRARPGEMVAIMGSSGAGKTSLLNVLAHRTQGRVGGEIIANGQPVTGGLKEAGYVTQEDNMFAKLTVRETLTTRALLALPRTMSREDKLRRVEDVLQALGLTKCADQFVGNELQRGVSGGERRRLTIGEALITNPSLIYLDEPTSGLDAATSLAVMDTLKMLAKHGRTVVCTVHQPRSNIFNAFDKLMLLAQGHVVYFGDAKSAVEYFASLTPISFKCPRYANPADFFIDLITITGRGDAGAAQKRIDYLIEQHNVNAETEVLSTSGTRSVTTRKLQPTTFQTNWLQQTAILTQRAWRNHIRSWKELLAQLLVQIFIAVLVGLTFLQLPLDQTSWQNRSGVIFFILLMAGFGALSRKLHAFPFEKTIVNRERASGIYRVSAYLVGKVVAELLVELSYPIIFLVIVYWTAGLNPWAIRFFVLMFLLLLHTLLCSAIGLFVSALSPNETVAIVVGPMVLILSVLFSGFFVNAATIPVFMAWGQWIDWLRYLFEAAIVNEFAGQVFTCTAAQQLPNGQCPIPNGEAAIALYGFGLISPGVGIAIVAGFTVLWYLLAYVALRWIAKPAYKRRTAQIPLQPRVAAPVSGVSGWDGMMHVVPQPRHVTVNMEDEAAMMEGLEQSVQRLQVRFSSARPHDELAAHFQAVQPTNLEWRNIKYDIPVKGKEPKCVLQGVSGHAFAGDLVAIMGASGAGKTSLLAVLSRRAQGVVTGKLLVNGEPVGATIANAGYVAQDYTLFATLTVRETLIFAAMLRLPADIAKQDKLDKVEQVITELGLQHCANTRVGSEVVGRGLSGGEMRRLAIGEVLISNPGLIFLDEPTTGLDAATSLSVMETLRNLASSGRTVLCTIHQPRSNIFAQFDKLLLLAPGGKTVYFGPASQAVDYFAQLRPVGYPCPMYTNPADFFLDLTTAVSTEEQHAADERLKYLVDSWTDPALSQRALQVAASAGAVRAKGWQHSYIVMLYYLMQRQWRNQTRQPITTLVRGGQNVVFAVLIGLLYLHLGFEQQDVQNRTGALFWILMFTTFAGVNSLLNTFHVEKAIFLRERTARTYRVSAYVLAKVICESLYDVLFPVIFASIIYWIIFLKPTAEAFFIFMGFLILMSFVGTGLGLALSAGAPSAEIATTFAPIVLVLFALYGGFYANTTTIPVWLAWIRYISLIFWGYQALVTNEFTGQTFECNIQPCPIQTGEQHLALLGFPIASLTACAFILLGMGIFYRLLAYIELRFLIKQRFTNTLRGDVDEEQIALPSQSTEAAALQA
eukprot:TRINITY_DN580_c0_g2_i1.p1 TRINITY_DN580_c0_g2~~TRINITY_DN580_c0_g2_i1.p1  ORF type:complete len:1354 (-),score=287.08 TRINITY_DN580_c0_g2_i1:518-4579(-)